MFISWMGTRSPPLLIMDSFPGKKNGVDERIKCVICLDPESEDSRCIQCPKRCSSHYHYDCLTKWCSYTPDPDPVCPYCRQPLAFSYRLNDAYISAGVYQSLYVTYAIFFILRKVSRKLLKWTFLGILTILHLIPYTFLCIIHAVPDIWNHVHRPVLPPGLPGIREYKYIFLMVCMSLTGVFCFLYVLGMSVSMPWVCVFGGDDLRILSDQSPTIFTGSMLQVVVIGVLVLYTVVHISMVQYVTRENMLHSALFVLHCNRILQAGMVCVVGYFVVNYASGQISLKIFSILGAWIGNLDELCIFSMSFHHVRRLVLGMYFLGCLFVLDFTTEILALYMQRAVQRKLVVSQREM